MLKLFFFKNKKSAIELSLLHLLEIVLAIAIVMLLIYLSLKLAGFFIGRQDYDSAINNLEELSKRINLIIKDKNNLLSQTMVYTIPDSFILVGFSYDAKVALKTECTLETITKSRLVSCQAKSCLCIYQNFYGKDFDDRPNTIPLKCKPFEEKIVFLAPRPDQYPDANFKGIKSQWKPNYDTAMPSYNQLIAYGQCGTAAKWGVRKITIRKSKEDVNIFIIINSTSNVRDYSEDIINPPP